MARTLPSSSSSTIDIHARLRLCRIRSSVFMPYVSLDTSSVCVDSSTKAVIAFCSSTSPTSGEGVRLRLLTSSLLASISSLTMKSPYESNRSIVSQRRVVSSVSDNRRSFLTPSTDIHGHVMRAYCRRSSMSISGNREYFEMRDFEYSYVSRVRATVSIFWRLCRWTCGGSVWRLLRNSSRRRRSRSRCLTYSSSSAESVMWLQQCREGRNAEGCTFGSRGGTISIETTRLKRRFRKNYRSRDLYCV